MAELLGAAPVGVPGAEDLLPVAQEDVHGEAAAGRGADVGPEVAPGGGVPVHAVADLLPVGEGLADLALGDDHEARVVGAQEVGARELRGEAGAAAALPLGAGGPHVVVGDQLRGAVEDVDQADRTVGPLEGVVGQLDHRQTPTLRGDRVELARGGLLALAQGGELAAPGLGVDDGRPGGSLVGRGHGRSSREVQRV